MQLSSYPEYVFAFTLRSIERKVLEDMRLGRWMLVLAAASTVLGVAAATWFIVVVSGDARSAPLPTAAAAIGGATAAICAGAVAVHRFLFSCAALFSSGLCAVLGVFSVWSQQTSAGAASGWTLLGVGAALILPASWWTVLAAPLSHSQPDMWAQSQATVTPGIKVARRG